MQGSSLGVASFTSFQSSVCIANKICVWLKRILQEKHNAYVYKESRLHGYNLSLAEFGGVKQDPLQ